LGEACSRTILDRLANGRLQVFENGAHLAHVEEPVVVDATATGAEAPPGSGTS